MRIKDIIYIKTLLFQLHSAAQMLIFLLSFTSGKSRKATESCLEASAGLRSLSSGFPDTHMLVGFSPLGMNIVLFSGSTLSQSFQLLTSVKNYSQRVEDSRAA